MKATAIIQARMGATRLPGKVLLKVKGKTILEYVVERVSRAVSVDRVVVATTVRKADLEIVQKASHLGVSVYCGDENDVLDRYYEAARLFKCEHIIRITADCPLMDPGVIDRVVSEYFQSGTAYCSNTIEESYPDGLDVEVFSFHALKTAYKRAALPSEREHVTPFIRNTPDLFDVGSVRCDTDLGDKRWTLDQIEDFELIQRVIENFYPDTPGYTMQDVVAFLDRNRGLESVNSNITRNEGYALSLKNEKTN